MASNFLNLARKEFFRLVSEHGDISLYVPNTISDGNDTITFSSKWNSQDVQGGTQPLVAYENVGSPTMQIHLKFNEDLCREFGNGTNVTASYTEIIDGFTNIQYPPIIGGKIKPPYCKIAWDGRVYRGYFTNVRIALSGPYLKSKKYRSVCEISAQFVISPKTMNRAGNVHILGNIT